MLLLFPEVCSVAFLMIRASPFTRLFFLQSLLQSRRLKIKFHPSRDVSWKKSNQRSLQLSCPNVRHIPEAKMISLQALSKVSRTSFDSLLFFFHALLKMKIISQLFGVCDEVPRF